MKKDAVEAVGILRSMTKGDFVVNLFVFHQLLTLTHSTTLKAHWEELYRRMLGVQQEKEKLVPLGETVKECQLSEQDRTSVKIKVNT
ncbi:hypothetical protein J6590_074635 [Homalodisca vitripennis]|nr:hypothetical protein J6590_074635 [Homalodisca vitripennis]